MEFSKDLLMILIFLGIGLIGIHLFIDPTFKIGRKDRKTRRPYGKDF